MHEVYLVLRRGDRDEQHGQVRNYRGRRILWSTRRWVPPFDAIAVDTVVLRYLTKIGIDDLYMAVPADGMYRATLEAMHRQGVRRLHAGRQQVFLHREHWQVVDDFRLGWLPGRPTSVIEDEPTTLPPPAQLTLF